MRLGITHPMVQVSEAEAAEWATKCNSRGELVGEAAKAKKWAKKVVKALEASRDGQRSLLRWITACTADELRDVQRALSAAPPGSQAILLADLCKAGVGGVAKLVMLQKLDKAMVPDSDGPLKLGSAFRLLPGRDAPPPPAGAPRTPKYTLPLRYAEGEEEVRGAADGTSPSYVETSQGLFHPHGLRLLDAGQRLAPDGTMFNVVRLHRIFAMQSAAADRAGSLILERMLDEFVTLTLRSAFFDKASAVLDDLSEEEIVLKGKSEVLRYMINDGFSLLKVGGPSGKKANTGCQYVQPCMLTADGQTRVVLCAGTRESCGSTADRMRLGEQIAWSPWGTVLSIVRVEKPLETHYEWATFFQCGNFKGVKSMLDKDMTYYCILNQYAPENPKKPRFAAFKFEGLDASFGRLDSEMSRQVGSISVVSPPFSGEKLRDLRSRRVVVADEPASVIANHDPNAESVAMREQVKIAREAHHQCLHYGETVRKEAERLGAGGAEGPKRSVVHFAGRWLPLGEGANRKGQLVVCVRETIGWKYNSKPPPPKPGDDGDPPETPSASRKVGFLCREFFIDTSLHEPSPLAPGFGAAWAMHKQRTSAS